MNDFEPQPHEYRIWIENFLQEGEGLVFQQDLLEAAVYGVLDPWVRIYFTYIRHLCRPETSPLWTERAERDRELLEEDNEHLGAYRELYLLIRYIQSQIYTPGGVPLVRFLDRYQRHAANLAREAEFRDPGRWYIIGVELARFAFPEQILQVNERVTRSLRANGLTVVQQGTEGSRTGGRSTAPPNSPFMPHQHPQPQANQDRSTDNPIDHAASRGHLSTDYDLLEFPEEVQGLIERGRLTRLADARRSEDRTNPLRGTVSHMARQ